MAPVRSGPGDPGYRFPAAAGHFDPARGAWILSRYADVAAALRDPRLAIPGAEHSGLPAPPPADARGPTPAQLDAWRVALETAAHERLRTLPTGRPVDLVRDFAEPWSLGLALQAARAPAGDAAELQRAAREVFLAAALATRPDVPPGAMAATAALARRLEGGGGPLGVQTFVALSQTLPCLLAAAWRELFRHPEPAARIRAEPARMPAAVEELLRRASPARAVFRLACAPVRIGDAAIGAGDRVILMLAAANHDPARFPEPERLDFGRRANRHLALGSGPHACAGSRMVRMAVAGATGALLNATDSVEEAGPCGWIGGFAIRGPATLPVVLHRRPDGTRLRANSPEPETTPR